MQLHPNYIRLVGMLSATRDYAFTTDWARKSWVYVYMFSSGGSNKVGFGGYSPTVASPLSEYSESGTFNMAPYEGTHSIRLGTKNSGI